jgi:cation transport ATPase
MPEGSMLDTAKAAMKRGLIAFLVVDAIFIAGAVALYLGIVRPQIARVEAARDDAVRANIAMTTRVRAVEGRLALATGDRAGAANAAADIQNQLKGLLMRIPPANASEVTEVTSLGARAALVGDEISRDPALARKDFELIEARLGALYPAPVPAAK